MNVPKIIQATLHSLTDKAENTKNKNWYFHVFLVTISLSDKNAVVFK